MEHTTMTTITPMMSTSTSTTTMIPRLLLRSKSQSNYRTNLIK